MEWCSGERVMKDQNQRIRFPLQERWKQWGDLNSLHRLENGTTDEAGFSCDSLLDNVEMYRPLFQGNRQEISCVREEGVSEESSLYWSTLLNNQDYQPYGLSGTNQTEENFMSYLLLDDVCANEQFHFYGSPKSHGSFSLRNDLACDMLLDPSSDLYNMHHMSSYEHSRAEDFLYSLDWEKNQSDAAQSNCSDTMTNAIPQYNTPSINVKVPPQQACSSWMAGDQPSVEETVLQELGSATQKMTEESRLCFRDALYRLASNSEKYSRNRYQYKDGRPSEMLLETAPPDQTLRSSKSNAYESTTNTIDRAIAELMFNKSYLNNKSHQELVSSVKPYNTKTLKKLLAPHFQHFSGPTPEDAVVPTLGQGEPHYLEY